jgi:hypothetical protein
MHYGHPDIFDRVFHLTRGGISKANKVLCISEDIFGAFNSTLKGGKVRRAGAVVAHPLHPHTAQMLSWR